MSEHSFGFHLRTFVLSFVLLRIKFRILFLNSYTFHFPNIRSVVRINTNVFSVSEISFVLIETKFSFVRIVTNCFYIVLWCNLFDYIFFNRYELMYYRFFWMSEILLNFEKRFSFLFRPFQRFSFRFFFWKKCCFWIILSIWLY